jgi:hypothetical protein
MIAFRCLALGYSPNALPAPAGGQSDCPEQWQAQQHRLDRTCILPKAYQPYPESLFQLDFSEVKHEKQVKQQREPIAFLKLGPSSPFVFGKINNVYLLHLGHDREFLLLPGVLEGNIGVSIRVQAGVSLAMLKPYYLKLI